MTVGSGQLSVFGDNMRAKLTSGKILVWLLATVLLITASPIEAQAQNIPRIAYLGGGSAELEKVWLGAFLQGLRELGYFEGSKVKTSS